MVVVRRHRSLRTEGEWTLRNGLLVDPRDVGDICRTASRSIAGGGWYIDRTHLGVLGCVLQVVMVG